LIRISRIFPQAIRVVSAALTVVPHPGAALRERRLLAVEGAFASMPERYLGGSDGFELLGQAGFDSTFEVRLGDIGRTWQVRVTPARCAVAPSPTREPDVVIGTDAETWMDLREGRLSGLDAFAARRLYARGNLDLALAFEGLFALPGDRPPLIRVHKVRVRDVEVSTLTAGDGEEHVICIHGLGSNKTSFFETVAALAPDHTVHAIDLPGFGSSSKPARGGYDAPYFASAIRGLMDELGLDHAHLVGNSMGGRVALEVALGTPERVASLSLLAPALAFVRRRELVPLVKLIRPELAAIPHSLRQARVRAHFWSMFAQPERLDPAAADIACDEFSRTYRSRSARIAFYAAARNIYLDAPHGERGLYTRLRELDLPTLFVWGDQDRLVPAAFARHVAEALPEADQVILTECGHVPQVELPDETNALIRETVARGSEAIPAAPLRLARTA
jgi:pimeloyl-ACP methyl ester carboxylesterase